MWTVTVAPGHQGEPSELEMARGHGRRTLLVTLGPGCVGMSHSRVLGGFGAVGPRAPESWREPEGQGRSFLPLGGAPVVLLYKGTL